VCSPRPELDGSQPDGHWTDGHRLAGRLGEMTVTEALDRLGSACVPAARVLSRFDVLTDPWLAENRMFHSVPDATVGAYYGVRSFADWPQCATAPSPRSFAIGDDTAEILARITLLSVSPGACS
jgi:crotonobetainyl-CoA:carnitine CoA-transferase CaiB-like acyl-CoA transferase